MMQILRKDRGHTFLVIHLRSGKQLGDNDRQANMQTSYSYIKKKTELHHQKNGNNRQLLYSISVANVTMLKTTKYIKNIYSVSYVYLDKERELKYLTGDFLFLAP